jgi:predicted HTH domain antitoxin
MQSLTYIPKTDLARRTRQVIRTVQQGQTVVVESHGEAEVAIMDILDYRLVKAVLRHYARPLPLDAAAGLSDEAVAQLEAEQDRVDLVLGHYLAESISLGRVAELLALPWLELRTRFIRLDIPLRTGPATLEELQDDLANAAAFFDARS